MADSKLLDKIFQSVWGRLFIVVTQTVLSSLVLLATFLLRQSGDITLLKYTIVLGLGFIAGFSARRFLKGHTQTLKLLAATISAVLSLVILHTLSGGFLGLNLFTPLNKNPDWFGLIQFGLAAFGALLAIQAFKNPLWIKDLPVTARPPRRSSPISRPGIKGRSPKPNLPSGKKIVQKSSRVGSGKKASLSVGKSTPKKDSASLASLASLAKGKKTSKVSAPHKLSLASVPTRKIKKPARPKTKRSRKKSAKDLAKDIKFVGVEEYNCPYCLDPVVAHDPRGVKICPICKTHHHADCWGITGACQIPHSQK